MHMASLPTSPITQTTTPQALAWFDNLDPVPIEFMIGRWQGQGIPTNHPLDALLEASHWYGKEFIDPETVHPLLFRDHQGQIIKVAPNALAMNWAIQFPPIKPELLQPLFRLSHFLLQTDKSQARLRLMAYRGQVSATMVYDYLPICDSFRQIDDHTVLGVMDMKGLPQPFFFRLHRVGAREG